MKTAAEARRSMIVDSKVQQEKILKQALFNAEAVIYAACEAGQNLAILRLGAEFLSIKDLLITALESLDYKVT